MLMRTLLDSCARFSTVAKKPAAHGDVLGNRALPVAFMVLSPDSCDDTISSLF
jgi:hypothetical protein